MRPELKKEILKNQELFDSLLNLSPNDAAIFINGMYFDVDVLDTISLLEVLRQELRTMERLHKIGMCIKLKSLKNKYLKKIMNSKCVKVNLSLNKCIHLFYF